MCEGGEFHVCLSKRRGGERARTRIMCAIVPTAPLPPNPPQPTTNRRAGGRPANRHDSSHVPRYYSGFSGHLREQTRERVNLALSQRRRHRQQQAAAEWGGEGGGASSLLPFIPLVDLAPSPTGRVVGGGAEGEGEWAYDGQGLVRVSEAGLWQRRVMRRTKVGVWVAWRKRGG
jgi:hypothetical protein